MRNRFFPIIFLLLALIALVVVIIYTDNGTEAVEGAIVSFPNGEIIKAELSLTSEEHVKGLSGRDGLEKETGMLFIHESKNKQCYWMKGMLFPIDIIWIDDNRIVGWVDNARPQSAPPYTLYFSPAPVDRVLEVPAGFVDNNNLERGDLLDINIPKQ